jgi:hypothetical protein
MTEAIGIALIVGGIVVLFVLGARLPKRESPLKIVKPPLFPPTDQPQLSVFDELDRLGPAGRAKAESDEKLRKWLRPFGVFGRLTTYAVLFLLLYAYWPSDISHRPLASLTLSDVFGTVAAVAITLVLIRALFEPSDDDGIKDAWGWLGVLIVALAVLAVFYLSSQR